MPEKYISQKELKKMPRIPLDASVDLTYRCNNNCRHCWLRISANDLQKNKELTCDEIKNIVQQAKKLGTRHWSISGGEPMLRPDFAEIFDYLTQNSIGYSLNTNGTLITPQIAQQLKRKGSKMVALYGATAKIHDHITRNPGSFELTMRGFSLLKEAGAGFIVQIIPLHDNFHEYPKMLELAKTLSPHYRIGAPWLYLSAYGNPEINEEIKRQRLTPEEVINLDKPDILYDERYEDISCGSTLAPDDTRLFASCIANRRNFHMDPYGQMTFCSFIKEPTLRYDLRKGSVKDGWENFIPSLTDKILGTPEYSENCGPCELKKECRWCPVFGYLEHQNFSKKVDYLCEVAKKNKTYKENWLKNHRRYYKIGDITIQVNSELPMTSETFHTKLTPFQVQGPGKDTVSISHHFSLPDIQGKDLGERLYYKAPWSIYKKGNSWIYLGISSTEGEKSLHRVAIFNKDHTQAKLFHVNADNFNTGNLSSLTLFPTDQIYLAQLLADREGCFMHSCGVILNGQGLLFVGHSEAGKSTTTLMLKNHAKILCDDRNIIRKTPQGFQVYGSWSHGDVPDISPDSAPLKGIFFLEKSPENKITPLSDKKEILKKLIACLIKPFETTKWWEKELNLLEQIVQKVPFYRMEFDKSGKIVEQIKTI